jgi:proton-dependent oligopeptide transporter, POT family
VHSIFWGILISSLALFVCGATMSGALCILGILVFAVGEMMASPKMNDYLGVIAPEGQKALYMGYANMPYAIGWALGDWVAGLVYDARGDKANLAMRYLASHGGAAGVDRTKAFETLCATMHLDATAGTKLLWDTYQPWHLWIPFSAVGMLSAVGIWFYARWVRADEADL